MNRTTNTIDVILATLTIERHTSSIPILTPHPLPARAAADLTYMMNRRVPRRSAKRKKAASDPIREPWSFISLVGGRSLLSPSTQH